jgi:hypothetical protein
MRESVTANRKMGSCKARSGICPCHVSFCQGMGRLYSRFANREANPLSQSRQEHDQAAGNKLNRKQRRENLYVGRPFKHSAEVLPVPSARKLLRIIRSACLRQGPIKELWGRCLQGESPSCRDHYSCHSAIQDETVQRGDELRC